MTLLSLKTEHFILESNFACSLEQHCPPPPTIVGRHQPRTLHCSSRSSDGQGAPPAGWLRSKVTCICTDLGNVSFLRDTVSWSFCLASHNSLTIRNAFKVCRVFSCWHRNYKTTTVAGAGHAPPSAYGGERKVQAAGWALGLLSTGSLGPSRWFWRTAA